MAADLPSFTCICGAKKQTSNHWSLARVTDKSITFSAWDTHLAFEQDQQPICGEGCAAKLQSLSIRSWDTRVHVPVVKAATPAVPLEAIVKAVDEEVGELALA